MPWILACILCGCAWGALAVLLVGHRSQLAWTGVLASPLIGLLVGIAMRPLRHAADADWEGRLILSILGLYLAVALFGMTTGAARGLRLSAGPAGVVLGMINDVVALWIGLTLSGFVVLLLPLSLATHLLVWHLQRRADPLANDEVPAGSCGPEGA